MKTGQNKAKNLNQKFQRCFRTSIEKNPIDPHRIRKITGSFAFIEHRFLRDRFLGKPGSPSTPAVYVSAHRG